jgi:uncharacterized protein (TIGR02594 family)
LKRRKFLEFGAAAASMLLAGVSRGEEAQDVQTLSAIPHLPGDLTSLENRPDFNTAEYEVIASNLLRHRRSEGLLEPRPEEVAEAASIVKYVGSGGYKTPFLVAQCLLEIAAGLDDPATVKWQPYMRSWPERANPLIVEFFRSTTTVPAGDTTAWCAAFVNWCSWKSHPPSARSGSAAAASYRPWGDTAVLFTDGKPVIKQLPRQGDLVVFKNRNDPAFGHVCFYESMDDKFIVGIGGNQYQSAPAKHAICRQRIAINGRSLFAMSIRYHPDLHRS